MRFMAKTVIHLLVAAMFLSGCAGLPTKIEKPQLSLERVTVLSASLMQQTYRLTVRIDNPNPIAVPIKALSYSIRLAGSEFASGVTPNSFSVPANGENLVAIDVSTNLLQTARQLMTFLSGKPDAIDYQLAGQVEIDLPFINPVAFSRTGQVAITSLID